MMGKRLTREGRIAFSDRRGLAGSRGERGMALIVALMMALLLSVLGVALVLVSNTETAIAANYRESVETMYAADAAIEIAMQDLRTVSDWNTILQGWVTSAFVDGNRFAARRLPDGSVFDLAQATNMANCGHTATCTVSEMDASTLDRPWGANNPRWMPYAFGPIADIVPTGSISSSVYVVLWVADDPSENDSDPTTDGRAPTNPGAGVLSLRAEAFGLKGAHRVIEATVARGNMPETGQSETGKPGLEEQDEPESETPALGHVGVRILSWRDIR